MKPVLECRFFKTDTGAEPVRDWLKDQQWGWPMGKPLVDSSFGGGLAEVRSNVAGDQYRVLFCVGEAVMVLLQPKRDLDLARARQATLNARTRKVKIK